MQRKRERKAGKRKRGGSKDRLLPGPVTDASRTDQFIRSTRTMFVPNFL